MVAEYSYGRLTRSLVRIPNGKADRTASAAIADLSRVSPLAASVPVCLAVPPGLQSRPPSASPSGGGPEAPAASASGKPPMAKRPRPSAGAGAPAKRASRGLQGPPGHVAPVGREARRPPGAAAVAGRLRQQQQQRQALVVDARRLLQEREQLRQENLAMKQQLSLFQMLFRDREKLLSVLRTLGIQAH